MLRNKILMWIWETPQSSCVLSVEFLEAMINGSFYVLFKDPASRQTPRVADGSGRPLAPQWSWCAPACSKPDASTRSIYAGSACGHRRTPNTCCSSTRGIAAGWRTVTLAAATWGIRGLIREGMPQMLDRLERRHATKIWSHPTSRWGRPALS